MNYNLRFGGKAIAGKSREQLRNEVAEKSFKLHIQAKIPEAELKGKSLAQINKMLKEYNLE